MIQRTDRYETTDADKVPMRSLRVMLEQMTREGELYEPLPDGRLLCYACGHECKIAEGHSGVCRVRFNAGGKLRVPGGYVGALACDPIEKKPFYHAFPGRDAMSFGMLGCDLHCGYCQNWVTSQALRDANAVALPGAQRVTAAQLVDLAIQYHAPVVASTYNEPLITSEWAVEIFKLANRKGLRCAYISNGNATRRVLEYLRPWVTLYKVDLKSFQDKRYRELGGQLANVLRTIRQLKEMGFWLEIVTLIVPGFNDDEGELREMAGFIAGVSRDIPWHVTAFHSDYKMNDAANTTAGQLVRACEIGTEAGLRYVYAGNLPGRVGQWENTRCPKCGVTVIERYGFVVKENRLKGGCCGNCGEKIPGVW